MDTEYQEFMQGLMGDDGYQTDTEETTVETDATQPEESEETETTAEATEGSETEENPSDENTQENPDEAAEADTEPEKAEETFTLKVNKEEKQYSREEMITLAQKGADYDRVKEQLSASRENAKKLEETISGSKDTLEELENLAKEMDCDVPEFLKRMKTAAWKKQGLSDDAIEERMLRESLQKENARLKAEAERNADMSEAERKRMDSEVAEFKKRFPDVELDEELIKKLTPGVQEGKTLTETYLESKQAEKDAEIKRLKDELEAEKKNRENNASALGSQSNAGSRKAKSDYDIFMEGLLK